MDRFIYFVFDFVKNLVDNLGFQKQAWAGVYFEKDEVVVGAEAIGFVPLAAEKNVPVTFQPADNLPLLQADAARLRQVLHNLLANALRHTPHNGQIIVATTFDGETATLAVKDNGDGIAPDALPYLFERFYRADKSRQRTQKHQRGGRGLGLAIVKAIVEGHNGRLTASSPGLSQGCTMTISLPQTVI